MDTRTGRIELIATTEDELDAQMRGLMPLNPAQLKKVAPMNRADRMAWAARHRKPSAKTVKRADQRSRAERKAERKRQRNARKANR